MESTRFTTEDIETSRLPRIPRRRRRRSCCSSCNSQIVCSYLIALISSILVVSGVYLAVTQWNRIWLIISVSGFLLTLFGSCLYYCGTQSLVNSYPHSDQDSYDYEEEDCDNDETHFPHSRHQTRDRGRKKRRKRGRPSPPDYVTRSLSQLSLNMIPQYFSPADTSFIRIPPGHLGTSTGLGTSTSLGTSTNLGTSTSLGGCDPSTVSAGVGTITNSHNPVPVSQIFSVNGQSYLILPLNNDSLPPPTLSSGGGTVGGGTDASTGLGRTLVGRQSENLLRLPLHEFPGCPEVITEKGNIAEYLKGDDSRYYKVIVSSNQKKEAPTNEPSIGSIPAGSISHGQISHGQISHGAFGGKINRKSLNRGRVAPGHHGSPSRIQETPLPPTPGSSQSNQVSSTPVAGSILDHNPLARIHSVTSGRSVNPSPTPGLIPKRSTSLRSATSRSTSLRSSIRPLVEERREQPSGCVGNGTVGELVGERREQPSGCVENGTVGEASTSNYFISFNPSHDGKVSSASFPLTTSLASLPFNPGMCVTGNSNQDTSDGTSPAADGASSTTSSAPSIQRGDTFSKRRKGSSLSRSMSEDSTQPSSSSSHGQHQPGNSSSCFTCNNGYLPLKEDSDLTCNNGYLPLNEDSDESGEVITTTCASGHSKDNQRLPGGSSVFHDGNNIQSHHQRPGGSSVIGDGNNIQSHQESGEQKRGKRIRTKLVDLSSQNFAPSSAGASSASSAGASFASSSSGVEKEGTRGRVNDTNHQRNCSSFSSDGRLDSQVTVSDGRSEADDECHALYATSGYHDEDMIANIYEETEDLILDVSDTDHFSPPPSYAEVVQDSAGISYAEVVQDSAGISYAEVVQDSAGISFTPAVNYDSRNFPTFINPVSASKQQQLDHNSVVIVMDSKAPSQAPIQNPRQPSNNPATEPGAIHSTGTL